jgi:methionyl aminopeptidase
MQKQQVSEKIIPTFMPEDIELIRQTSFIARDALDVGHAAIKVGVTTEEIDKIVHDFIIENNGYPSPLNYYGFPRSCCTSINEVICHGIPDTRPL